MYGLKNTFLNKKMTRYPYLKNNVYYNKQTKKQK